MTKRPGAIPGSFNRSSVAYATAYPIARALLATRASRVTTVTNCGGVAYREYFATDSLMFGVPRLDTRLPSKAEVLALRLSAGAGEPLAISAAFLRRHPVYQDRIGDVDFVVLTDRTGANRVYASGGRRFVSWDGRSAADVERGSCTGSEAALTSGDGVRLRRLPAHRAFWFGWCAAYPGTRLVK